jgi:molybdopterin molybdotransferase
VTGLPDYGEALRLALGAAHPTGGTETLDLCDALGRVLREAIAADRDLPPFNRAQMDGYALRAAELGRYPSFRVAATIAAGQPANVRVAPGHCVAIATGAPLPEDTDTVVQHEQSDRGNPVRFTSSDVPRGHAVHARGADARRGDTLVAAGTVLGPQHVGIAAAVGRQKLVVAHRPRALVLTSGDEVVHPGAAVAGHQIRNSNAPMLAGLLRRMGAEPIGHRHLPDRPGETSEALRGALAAADLVVTVGGVSAGERDCFPEAFREHGIEIALRGAAIQPGRPVIVGRAPGGAIIVGLPGNPVSVLACACLFVWPIVRVMLGLDAALPWRVVELAERVTPNARRRAFRPAILEDHDRARVPAWAGSGDLAHTAPTAGLVELPVQAETVPAGTVLRFLPWPE